MMYICLFLLALTQTLSATESENKALRMGFNHGKNDISVLFENEASLKYKEVEDGKQIYYIDALNDKQKITYEFGYHGHSLEGLETFKNKYIETVRSSLVKNNPAAKCSTIADEKLSNGKARAIVENVTDEGKRTLFVGDFRSVEGKIYVMSEMIECTSSEARESLIDESFFSSFELQRK